MTDEERFRRALQRIGDEDVPRSADDPSNRAMAANELATSIAIYAAHVLADGDPDVDHGYEPNYDVGLKRGSR